MIADIPYTLHRSSIEPGNEAVDRALAKKWLRLLGDEENDLVDTVLQRSSIQAENAFGRAILKGTWVLSYKAPLPRCARVILPRPPLVSLDKVEYRDADQAAWLVVDPADYVLVESEPLGVVVPAETATWPYAPIRFTYTAGYTSWEAPTDLKTAVLELAAWNFEHRGDQPSTPGVGGSTGPPPKIRSRYPHLVVYPG